MKLAYLSISEREFTEMVVELAGYLGWRVYHTFDSRRSASGFPDLCLVRENADGTASLASWS